jgi:hypothetical protein
VSEAVAVLRTASCKHVDSIHLKETMQHGVTMGPTTRSLRNYTHGVEMARASTRVGERVHIVIGLDACLSYINLTTAQTTQGQKLRFLLLC